MEKNVRRRDFGNKIMQFVDCSGGNVPVSRLYYNVASPPLGRLGGEKHSFGALLEAQDRIGTKWGVKPDGVAHVERKGGSALI